MQNPFESGHIKNYILLYVSVVVIMVLFFIASTLFHDVENMEKKKFNSEVNLTKESENTPQRNVETNTTKRFQLMKTGY